MTSVAILAMVLQAYSVKQSNLRLIREVWFSLPMSSSVALCAHTQNLMTNRSLTEAGTMCSLPDALIVESSFWFSSSVPVRRKQTRPT